MKVKRRVSGSAEMNLSSSSDISFLLIIFFLVTSAFIFKDGLHITLPEESSEPVVVYRDQIAIITVLGSGGYLINDEDVTSTEMENELIELQETIPDLMVLIQIEPEASYQNVIGAVDSLQYLGIVKFSFEML